MVHLLSLARKVDLISLARRVVFMVLFTYFMSRVAIAVQRFENEELETPSHTFLMTLTFKTIFVNWDLPIRKFFKEHFNYTHVDT